MPILFRCPTCNQKLSITRKRAGTTITCPQCKEQTRVPTMDEVLAAAKSKPAESQQDDVASSPPTEDVEFDEADLSKSTPEISSQTDAEVDGESALETSDPVFESQKESQWAPRRDAQPHEAADDDEEEFQIRKAETEFEEMDLTPMVDVTFLLLIFFMITASFSLQKTIPTPVPDPDESSASQPIQQQEDILDKSIMIEIDNENRISLDDEPIPDPNMLPDRLQQIMSQDRKSEVLVTVGDQALQGTVVFVLDTANELNVSKIRLAASSGRDD